MALYKYGDQLTSSSDTAFDTLYEPGQAAPHAGIYRCHACGSEIGIAMGHTLPSQNHHQHAPGQGSIRWRLLVYPVPKK